MDRNPRPRGRNQWAKTQKYAVHNYVTVPQVEEDTPPKTAEEVIKRNLKNWPWGQTVPRKLLTLAPYLLNKLRDENKPRQPFGLREIIQNGPLFTKLLSNDIIRQKLTDLLFINHDTAWKFAATSRHSWRAITQDTASWDFTRGWFGNCEIPRDNYLHPDNLIAEPIQGSVPSVVIISPVRGPKVFPENIEELDEVKEKVDMHLYEDQARSLHKMCLAFYNFADYFKNLQLHRIALLSTKVLELIVPMMRNLEVLGIYQCQLIHVGETVKLLDILQVDRVTEKKNQVKLDFYPNYHQGPISFAGYKYHTGCYGVTWDNWDGDTRLGLWQLVAIIMLRATQQEQDFYSEHTMFRQWLDKSLCWRVEETLQTLIIHEGDARTEEAKDEALVVMVDTPRTGGSVQKFKSNIPNRTEGWRWMVERHPCHKCRLNPLGIFFPYSDIRYATIQGFTGYQTQLTCMSCRLISVLNNEKDHYKALKREIISQWLRENDDFEADVNGGVQLWNTTNMPKALNDFFKNEVPRWAWRLDCQRARDMQNKTFPLDREHDEVQYPFLPDELNTKFGMRHRTPTVDNRDPVYNFWNEIADPWGEWSNGYGR